ncbi:acyl-CoA thioesterase [Abyssalbus ytuae]|uniref:Acyl-CoA thioesterase n=1 Tax=Abyssalbus ytuae TaxID=2926907 RepID=A0A9E6ZKW9_9FLAO|nr:acyl-CoA thioesterase [Abyssalbus ytuae]UOB17639.1 acyl-CoA thioesterase [Abyssalbus ytuae]
MNHFPKILESTAKIRFQDCDPFNHLNNSRYLDYFINAREDQLLENYGVDLFKIVREENIGWVVSSSQVSYIKPVFTMEKVVIESQLLQYSGKHLMVEARMWDSSKSALKSFCWMCFVHFNLKTNTVEQHSARFIELFKNILNPVEENSFNEREINLRGRKS